MSAATDLAALTVAVITDPAEAETVAQDWERLVVTTDRPGCGPGWLLAWFRHIGARDGDLHLLVVRERGDVVGLLPGWLCGRPGARTLRLLGVGLTHRLSVLAAPERRAGVAAAIARHVAQDREVCAIRLEGLSDDDPLPADLRRAWPGRRPPAVRELVMAAPVAPLSPDGYETWLSERSKALRKNIRQQTRRLEELGGIVGRAEPHETREVVDALARLHGAQWAARGQPGAIDDRTLAMLHEAAERLVPVGRIWLFALRVGGTIRAADLVIAAGRRLHAVIGGYEPVERLSPGVLTLDAVIRAGHEQGARLLDLGGGNDEYKQRLGSRDDPLAWWTFVPPDRRAWRGGADHVPRLLHVRGREFARDRLSAGNVDRLKALRRRLSSG